MPSQAQLFYDAQRRAAERDRTFLELAAHPTNPMTQEDLARNIERRPALWGRYAGFMDLLPRKVA